MRTTSPSSEPPRPALLRRVFALPLAVAASGLLGWGCAAAPRTTPIELFQLAPESAAHKATQTRRFETPDSRELLSASAAVLQDLGFQVVESVPELGFLHAAKERSAREYGQEIRRVIIAMLTSAGNQQGQNNTQILPVDLHQRISVSLVASPLDAAERHHELRVTFFRLVWRGDGQRGNFYIAPGQQRMEMIRRPEIYQQFFSRLSKAVFLEAHRI